MSDKIKPSLASLKISKTDAAKRQLETAIRLWFYDGEPASIHTLAAAALQVVHDLGKARGVSSMLKDLPTMKPEYKKHVRQAFAKIENFLKHADRDPDVLLEFNPTVTVGFLLDAAVTYEHLTGERPSVMRTFQMWTLLKNPELVKEDTKAAWTNMLVQVGPALERISKQEFFTAYQSLIAKNEAT